MFADEMGTDTSLAPLCTLGRDRGASACERAVQPGLERYPAGEHGRGRDKPVPGGRRLNHEEGPRALSGADLSALAQAGQVVAIDSLSSHKGPRVREPIEERGCELVYLPPHSSDVDPI